MTQPTQSLNLELLIKLLKLTTSSNDGEALLAGRKANEVLAKFGGDWEALLRGKVTVIADPFSAAPIPTDRQAQPAAPSPYNPPPPRAPSPPQAPPRPQHYQYTPRTPPRPAQPAPQPTHAPIAKKHKRGSISLDELA